MLDDFGKRVRISITMRELVEWTYAIQQAHRGGELRLGGASISATGRVIERLQLGCAIDGGGGYLSGIISHIDEDALTVHGNVERMSADARALLIGSGEHRSPPDWSPRIEPLRVVSVPGNRGKPKGIYAHSGKTLIGHEITYEGDIPTRKVATSYREHWPDAPSLRIAEDVIEYARCRYVCWWRGLVELTERLCDAALRRWRIAGIGATRLPWENIPIK